MTADQLLGKLGFRSRFDSQISWGLTRLENLLVKNISFNELNPLPFVMFFCIWRIYRLHFDNPVDYFEGQSVFEIWEFDNVRNKPNFWGYFSIGKSESKLWFTHDEPVLEYYQNMERYLLISYYLI